MYRTFSILFLIFLQLSGFSQNIKEISESQLREKIQGYWVGQLAGNYVGFPFENLYTDHAIPIFIDRYFNFGDTDSLDIKMNLNDRRAYIHIMADAMGGAWSDDDTDIEFVTLYAIEKYGLDLDYEEITESWKSHINRFIWSANLRARKLMDQGFVPPATGSKKNNENWYRITSQLVNEIWGAIYPGMTTQAGRRAEWGAKIMCDDWATHVTKAYGIMYSAAFFEKDISRVIQIAIDQLPSESPFRRGVESVQRWHALNKDWRDTRALIHQNYYQDIDGFTIPFPVAGSIVNGLSGVMALLYGDGDFTKTVAIATSAGYDCDNQAATCGGLIGVLNGASAIPRKFTHELPSRGEWHSQFNNQYINYSRDNLPNYNEISDIVDRILFLAKEAILSNGGKEIPRDGEVFYSVVTDL